MPIATIYSFLTYPLKNKPPANPVAGVQIPLDGGKLCQMLKGVFDNAKKECSIPVMFTSDNQENPVRTELLALFKKPGVAAATPLADRLQLATTGTSGIGLLFVCMGDDAGQSRIVISRFPADEGVVATHGAGKLTVEFVDQVFLKSALSYKAATYVFSGKADDIWKGHAIDKQTNHGMQAIADYWIMDFLKSEFTTTPATGTKRLALALKKVAQSSFDPLVKHEIVAAAQLAANLPNNALTILEFCDQFHMSPATKEAVAAVINPGLLNDRFKFDRTEFTRHISYRQIELDNGAVLSAPVDKFETCFKTVEKQNISTYTTSGSVVDERLRVRK